VSNDVWLACAVAGATAALLIPFGAYAHAVTWSRWSVVGLAGYLAANAIAGVLGAFIARKLSWRPENFWVRGLLWGEFGEALARLRFDRIPKPEGGGEAASAIGAIGSWMLGIVDWGVARAVDNRLAELSDAELAQYVSDLYRKGPAEDGGLHEAMKKYFGVAVGDALRKLTAAAVAEEDKVDARSSLRSLGASWVDEYKFAPPRRRP